MLQLLRGALHIIDDPLAAAVIFVAGVVPHVTAPPGQCQLLLKKQQAPDHPYKSTAKSVSSGERYDIMMKTGRHAIKHLTAEIKRQT